GSVIPNEQNMMKLCEIAENIEKKYEIEDIMVSGGNSSSLNMLADGRMPAKINNLRLGESIVCGLETAYGKPFGGLVQDVVILEATVIEIAKKPSMPEGETNINAFGETVKYIDSGEHLRAILAVGRQDTNYEGLTPRDEDVFIIGASSDHLIADITNAKQLQVGDTLTFSLSYGAILAGFTSKYVDREYI
ncbi:MAG: alanine/ornithine racemase family PLP-dependent enzyme, partial [Defluviitaleaceae bacterium]|nr:alanine/ornithine racemase family PLP-dependent enzyme [Defluviitaleaceae bacterium]